jgi:hypothetical protein
VPALAESVPHRRSASVTINDGKGSRKFRTFTIPAEIFQRGPEAICEWLARQLKEDACSKKK